MAKMTLKKWEKSSADKRLDKKKGWKEGSKADMKADKAAVARLNRKGK